METITSQSDVQDALVADFFALTGENNNSPEVIIVESVTTESSFTPTHGYFSETMDWLNTVDQNFETITYLQYIQSQAQLQQMACLCGPSSADHMVDLSGSDANNALSVYGSENQLYNLNSDNHNDHHCDECGGSIENNKCSKCGHAHHH